MNQKKGICTDVLAVSLKFAQDKLAISNREFIYFNLH
jgi:hypothetical protein